MIIKDTEAGNGTSIIQAAYNQEVKVVFTAMWAQLDFQFRRFESCRRPYKTFTAMIKVRRYYDGGNPGVIYEKRVYVLGILIYRRENIPVFISREARIPSVKPSLNGHIY